MDNKQQSDWEMLTNLFSNERLGPYYRSTLGNKALAEELYVWNNRVSSALWEQLAFLEVAIRNTISTQLEIRYEKVGCSKHWTFDPLGEFESANSKARDQLKLAQVQVLRNKRPLVPSQIISELPFGFWHLLLSKRFRFLWPDIAQGFRGLDTRNADEISLLLRDLRWLRNRIGHHHSIIQLDLVDKNVQIKKLAALIDPEFGRWMGKSSRIALLLNNYPKSSGIVAP